MKSNISKIGLTILGVILLNYLSTFFYTRIDVTTDKRYTLSKASSTILQRIDKPLLIKVYLEGDFPAEFKRLQIETKTHLEQLKSYNKYITFKFINPKNIENELVTKGFEPSRLQIQENGNFLEKIIFPWAEVSYNGKTEYVNLLKDIFSNTQNAQLESSIQNLEYAFSDAIFKVSTAKSKKIAVLKGNDELDDIFLADFLSTINKYYLLAPFSLDKANIEGAKTIENLTNFDLAVIAKPKKKFTENEKFTLDQFIMNGGKALWLVDQVEAELDSMMNTGETLAYPIDLNLTDLFFNYGFRINYDLIIDLQCKTIPLATGNVGNQTQFSQFPWYYYPITNKPATNPITSNIEAVSLKFANSIDTLKNNVTKTILLESSNESKIVGTPKIISLETISQKPSNLGETKSILGLLLEGEFKSGFSERVKPFEYNDVKDSSSKTQMIVVSDGDIIANDVVKGQPIELGVDKWTYQRFGNKEFLLNALNYLLDNNGLINIRSKTITLKFLNKEKAYKEQRKWQLINIVIPMILLAVFGVCFNYFRNKKYT